jgi:hypothetical protein
MQASITISELYMTDKKQHMKIISLNKGLGGDPENQSSFFIPPLRQISMVIQLVL